ncbi:MAG: uracil-DNA glycosylase [bacterium]
MLVNENGQFAINNIIEYPDNNYNDLKEKAVQCERCQLRDNCSQVVMGEGAVNKKIMFIGEAPGATEDKKGRPFVGRAGNLLDKIFSAVNIKREDVYITNVVKCRPPENRKPTITEAKACSPILQSEFKLIEPLVIVPMGATAFKHLLDEDTSITESRGKWFQRGPYYFLPTFHPAYLLRNKNMKKYTWRDFKLIKKAIERINEIKKENT